MTMVNTVEELKNMIALIKYHSKEIAVDLEVYHFKEKHSEYITSHIIAH